MAEKHKRTSFLRDAPVMGGGQFLGINSLPEIPASLNDQPYVIGHRYNERPDLLAHDIYGDSNLWWVFAIRNPDVLKDPIRDFVSGISIIVPSENTVRNL